MHRDIKPANILVSAASVGGDLQMALLGDIGIAREMAGSATRTHIAGTPVWIDPLSRAAGDPEI